MPRTHRHPSRLAVAGVAGALLAAGTALLAPATQATASPAATTTAAVTPAAVATAGVATAAATVAGSSAPAGMLGRPWPGPIVPSTPTPATPDLEGPDTEGSESGAAAPGLAAPVQSMQPVPLVPPVPGGGSGCGLGDIAACVGVALSEVLRAVVTDLVNAALEVLTDTLLQTPQPSQIPRLAQLWQVSWEVAVALYGVVILAGAVLVMAHHSVQTHYGLREIAPRLVVGFVAGWLTLPLADMAVQIANAVSDALLGPSDVAGGVRGLAQLVQSTLAGPAAAGGGFGPAWVVLALGLMLGVGLWALLFGYVLRVVATIVLIAAAPLVVMWHALPQTDGLARWWWRALGGVLAIQIVQALVLSVAGAILLLPDPRNPDPNGGAGGLAVFGLAGSGWVSLLVLAAVLWVLVKIPGWMWSVIRVGGGRRSLLGSAVRAAILWKTGGLLRGALTAATATRAARAAGGAAAGSSARSGSGGGADPYANPPVFPGGQLGLPLSGLRRRRAPARATPPSRGATAPAAAGGSGSGRARRGVQLALPLGQEWPENRPVLDRDGQYCLPIPVTRQPRPTPAAPSPAAALAAGPTPAVAPPRRRARQLSFDDLAAELDPFRGNRPLAGGQYPLPLPGLTRHPRPTTPPTPGPARAAPARPLPGQTRLPIPATPPRPTPPQRTPQRAPYSPTPPQPPSSPHSSSSSSSPGGRRSGGRRRPGQENPS